MPERVLLTIGTKKGLFVAEAPKSRGKFALRGPFGSGVAVYATLTDTRGKPRIYGSSCNAFFGMSRVWGSCADSGKLTIASASPSEAYLYSSTYL